MASLIYGTIDYIALLGGVQSYPAMNGRQR